MDTPDDPTVLNRPAKLPACEEIMSILFIENIKRLEFDITGYQFPDIRKLNIDHDANWLAVTFSYQDEKLSFKKADNCLLTYELKEII